MLYQGEQLKEIRFPLGGIGTGSVCIAGNGRLCDWEIMNRPNKGRMNGQSHFAVAATVNGKRYVRVLEGDTLGEFTGPYRKKAFSGYGFGVNETLSGFPHFKHVEFNGEFPVATLTFWDENFPGKVQLTAFNPFIPGNADDSSLPAAFFTVRFINDTAEKIDYQAAFSVWCPFDPSHNQNVSQGAYHAVKLYNPAETDENAKLYGDLTIATEGEGGTQTFWYRGGWIDGLVTYWNEFETGTLRPREYETPSRGDVATVWRNLSAAAGESAEAQFTLTWSFANCYNYWNPYKDEKGEDVMWKNYYATRFHSSVETAKYCTENFSRLQKQTLAFKNELFNSTLHPTFIDALSANLSTLKSPTVLRLTDGSFWAWEGVHELEGSCEGTCQRVWNYAYALCFLFPELERSIRNMELNNTYQESGATEFRIPLPLGRKYPPFRACVDGQMGTVIKIYREWKICGDDEWLRSVWHKVKKMIAYAWSEENPDAWDRNKDGVLEGRQHHTLDMEAFGPTPWLQGFYFAALSAGAEMARYLGEEETAKEYETVRASGYNWCKENLFNGEYFEQKVDLTDRALLEKFNCADTYWNEEAGEIKYQILGGCFADQLCGAWHANVNGLPPVFDKKQQAAALNAIVKYNVKDSLRDFFNPWRIYALNDEGGTVNCTYPAGAKKPYIPIPYCQETFSGWEYEIAGLLLAAGDNPNALRVTSASRNRYNGVKRNPYNEMECGSNYARSMSSFALLPIASGFKFDMPRKKLGFVPVGSPKTFHSAWFLGSVWGNVDFTPERVQITLCGKPVTLSTLTLANAQSVTALMVDGKEIAFTRSGNDFIFAETEISQSIVARLA